MKGFTRILTGGIAAAFTVVVLVGVIAAQETPTPTAAPVDLTCDVEELRAAKADLDALLSRFEDDIEGNAGQALANLYTVGETYQTLALDCGYIPADANLLVIDTTDVERVQNVLATLYGDPLNGQLLYNGEVESAGGVALGCSSCHMNSEVAPLTEGTWTRWDEQHSQEPRFADYTFEQYTVESILLPYEHTVEGYPENTMPDFYPQQLSYQNLADLIAYLNSQDQLLE